MPLLIRLYIKFEPDLPQTYQFDFEGQYLTVDQHTVAIENYRRHGSI